MTTYTISLNHKNPYIIVNLFEEAIAEYCGSKYAVAVESCTAAIFLSLKYVIEEQGWGNRETFGRGSHIIIPKYTYPGVANSIIQCGYKILFEDNNWQGEYELYPFQIWDAALRFKKGMYGNKGKVYALQCLSFHIRKLIPIGRGGAILTDDKDAYEWLKLARFDGREPVPLREQKDFTVLGYNMYMPPADAARGLQLLQALGDKELDDLKTEDQKYADLSQFKIYTQ